MADEPAGPAPDVRLDEPEPALGPAAGRTRGPDMSSEPPPRSREGVTVEQGEGWSMEIWPAPASVRAAHERAAQLSVQRETAMAGGAPVARSEGAADPRAASAVEHRTAGSSTAR